MSDVVISHSVRVDRYWLRVGGSGLVAALVANVLFNVNVSPGENGGTGPMIAMTAILIVVAAALYTQVFPRYGGGARSVLVTGIVTVVSLAAFWSAAPLLLGAATFGYGLRAPRTTAARVGMGLAAAAMLLDVIAALSNL